ncbi:MAG: hypothetical protein QOF63_1413 [Thermoanaerobaculia bacterium]|nr:hypothetical protein [Thermoanaerobaculia bacterium]MEA2414980.1 hypothetical protein [Thermoanaerobaculia bacterium]
MENFDDLGAPFGPEEFTALLAGGMKNNRISEWNQAGRKDVGTGICMGMCLDWIRRVLTGLSRTRLQNRESAMRSTSIFKRIKNAYRFKEQKNTHIVYGRAQAQTVSTPMTALKVEAAIQRIRSIDPHFANVKTIDEAEEVENQVPQGMVQSTWNDRRNRFRRETTALEHDLVSSLDARQALTLRLQCDAAILNALAASDAQTIPGVAFLKKKRAHSFGGLQVVEPSSQQFQAPLTEATFLRFIQERLESLSGDTAAVLSMGLFGRLGHDVAFYVGANRGFFCYLDPNVGEFYFGANEWTHLGRLLCAEWRATYGRLGYDWVSWTTYAFRT